MQILATVAWNEGNCSSVVANQMTQYQLYMKSKNAQDQSPTYSSMSDVRAGRANCSIGGDWFQLEPASTSILYFGYERGCESTA